MTVLNLTKDVKGFNTYGRKPAQIQYSVNLDATSGAVAVPAVPGTTQDWLVLFSYQPGSSVWAAINNTATLPGGASFAATNAELNPVAYQLKAGDVISMITSDTADQVGVVMYAL